MCDGAAWPDAAQADNLPSDQALQDLLLDTIALLQARRAALGEVMIDAALLPLMAQLAVPVAPTPRAQT